MEQEREQNGAQAAARREPKSPTENPVVSVTHREQREGKPYALLREEVRVPAEFEQAARQEPARVIVARAPLAREPRDFALRLLETPLLLIGGGFQREEGDETPGRDQVSAGQVSRINRDGQVLHRVRLGPVSGVDEADRLLAAVFDLGFRGARIIVD